MLFLLAPARAPDFVTAHATSSTKLTVKWSHVPEEHFQGQPIGYKITYYPVDLESDINFVNVNYRTKAKLTDLAVDTIYVINVSAVSSGGIGPGKATKARTDPPCTQVLKNNHLFCDTTDDSKDLFFERRKKKQDFSLLAGYLRTHMKTCRTVV